MGIGGSIFLIAVGAIIAFGVHYQLGWLDLSVVGWVLLLAGVVGLVITLWVWGSRRRVVDVPPAMPDERRYVEERRVPDQRTYVEERRVRDDTTSRY